MFISKHDKVRALELTNAFEHRVSRLERRETVHTQELQRQARMIDELAAALGARFVAIPAHDQLVPQEKVAALQPIP